MRGVETEGRPLPVPDVLDAPFWAAAQAGRLVIQRCTNCGRYEWTPQFACSSCLPETLAGAQVSGRGRVYASTIVGAMQVAGMPAPYVVAIVRLDEGIDMLTNIIGIDPEDVHIGQPVEVSFVQERDGISLPCFRPSSAD